MQLHHDEFDEQSFEDEQLPSAPRSLRDLETRELYARMRRPAEAHDPGEPGLPESVLWQVFVELRRRGDERAVGEFLRSVRGLLRRRSIGAAELSVHDSAPEEHRAAEDPFLGELWKAYKRCIQQGRTGPASQLLRDIERQMQGN